MKIWNAFKKRATKKSPPSLDCYATTGLAHGTNEFLVRITFTCWDRVGNNRRDSIRPENQDSQDLEAVLTHKEAFELGMHLLKESAHISNLLLDKAERLQGLSDQSPE